MIKTVKWVIFPPKTGEKELAGASEILASTKKENKQANKYVAKWLKGSLGFAFILLISRQVKIMVL